MVLLTENLIESLATDRGGYTKATIIALGEQWDDKHHSGFKGWKARLVGRSISEEQFNKAVAGRKKCVGLFD